MSVAKETPLLVVEGLTHWFEPPSPGLFKRGPHEGVHALSDVTFTVSEGETLGIVGESGSGKTTLARALLRLIEPTSGRVTFQGRNVYSLSPEEVTEHLRPRMRMIFQHPDAILNPGYSIGTALAKSIRSHREAPDREIVQQVADLLEEVGLDPTLGAMYPDELSSGQKRRVGICRALATDPDLIVADEPVAGLDVLLQERILGVLQSEQNSRGFALILVSHDLERVNQVCDRVLVMYGGRLMESLTVRRSGRPVREQFLHPYSILLQRARTGLVSAVDGGSGNASDVVSPAHSAVRDERHEGCPFRGECPLWASRGYPGECERVFPEPTDLGEGHVVWCHFVAGHAQNP